MLPEVSQLSLTHRARLLEDPVEHSVGPPPGRPDPASSLSKGLAHYAEPVAQGAGHELDDGRGDSVARRGGAVVRPRARSGRQPRSAHTASTPCAASPSASAWSAARTSDRTKASPRHGQRLLQLRQVLRADKHGGGPAIAGDHHSLVVALDPVHQLRQVVPPSTQRLRRHALTLPLPLATSNVDNRGVDAAHPPQCANGQAVEAAATRRCRCRRGSPAAHHL